MLYNGSRIITSLSHTCWTYFNQQVKTGTIPWLKTVSSGTVQNSSWEQDTLLFIQLSRLINVLQNLSGPDTTCILGMSCVTEFTHECRITIQELMVMRVYQWQGEHHANNYIRECIHRGSGGIISGYSANYQRDNYLRGCCHRMRLWGTTLHFLCQGLCCRRTMPVLLLGAMQNELQVTNTDTLPIPFPHICHQLNKPGVSWKVDYSYDCIQHRLYRIFIKQSSREWQLEHPTAGNEVPYLPHEALLSIAVIDACGDHTQYQARSFSKRSHADRSGTGNHPRQSYYFSFVSVV